jgi:hypothetical protein
VQPRSFSVELADGGEVQAVAGLGEEEGDQIWVAADDAELAAEFLFPVGHVTYPLPPPAREAGV